MQTPQANTPLRATQAVVTQDVFEWEEQVFFQARIDAGKNTFCHQDSRMCPADISFNDWVHANFPRYSMASSKRFVTYFGTGDEEVRVDFLVRKSNFEYCCYGDEPAVKKFEEWLSQQPFPAKEVMVDWAFGKDYSTMETYSLPLKIPTPLAGAYPWLNKSVPDYVHGFLKSGATVLVLIGSPGTGKTTFIKEMIQAMKTNAMVTYDSGLLFSDGFFAQFMVGTSTDVLVLEDADTMITSRQDGNETMNRFLNASDGLISLSHKKIIITTNLPDISSIDPALLRPGRCYDVLHARLLTKQEAFVVGSQLYDNFDITELTKQEYSLAEITHLREQRGNFQKRTIGFLGGS